MARNRWLMLAGTATALVFGVTAFSWARGKVAANAFPLFSDTMPNPPAPSAMLLRRLAETAEAFRTGKVVYIVVRNSGNYPILGGFPSIDSALRVARTAGEGWSVYPALTPPDEYGGSKLLQAVLPGCYKDYLTTAWICPPKDSSGTTAYPVALQDVSRIYVTIVQRNGRRIVVPLDPQRAGATIYTIQDFDRFIVPYYTRIYGADYAARMRDSLISFVRHSMRDSLQH